MPPTPVDWIAAIGTILTPLALALLAGVGWAIRIRTERTIKQEEALRDNRIEVYDQILEPFTIMFAKNESLAADRSNKGKSKSALMSEIIGSKQYRQAGFKMVLMGSDDVVRAYNNLMQFFFVENVEEQVKTNPRMPLEMMGTLLLEIRKSVGNEKTKLTNLEMLEFFITDIRQIDKR